MPCNSDHMNPTVKEQQRQKAAVLLAYVHNALGEPVPADVGKAIPEMYPTTDEMLVRLCNKMTSLDINTVERITYGNARDPLGRELATWWEQHIKEDDKREAEEKALAYRQTLVGSILSKLTPHELALVGGERHLRNQANYRINGIDF